MTDEQQHNSQHDEPRDSVPTPPPLPGQVFIRPGIDDRPDFEKALSNEDKAALRRLTIKQNPRQPGASGDSPEVQAAHMNAEGSPITAAAKLDTAVPNLESSFFDLRDPMVDASGYKPSTTEMRRLNLGFGFGAVLCTVPLAALNNVLVPMRIDDVSGDGRATSLALLIALGVVMSFISSSLVAVWSDHTRLEIGRRTPWIIGGGLAAALFALGLSAMPTVGLIAFFWCVLQAGYAALSTAVSAAFGERIPDKFRSRADAYRGIGLTVGYLLGTLLGVLMVDDIAAGVRICAIIFAVSGIITVLILPREKSSVELRARRIKQGEFFSRYRLPKGVPNFTRAFIGRLAMTAGVSMINVFVWYIVRYAINAGDLNASISVMAMTAVALFIGGVIATVALGPIADRWEDERIPAVLACGVYIVALAMPIMTVTAAGIVGYALIGGFAYTVFDGVAQRLGVAVLPDKREAGRGLAALNLASHAGIVIGVLLAAGSVALFGTYLILFPVAIIIVVVAAAETWSIHEQETR